MSYGFKILNDVSTVLPTDKDYALDLFTNVLQIPTPKCIQIKFTAIVHILKFLQQKGS